MAPPPKDVKARAMEISGGAVLKKKFDKSVAQLRHKGTVYAVVMFTPEETGSDLVGSWAFLKKAMRTTPHKHPAKEIYFFTKGQGFVQIGQKRSSVKAGDAVYIPPNTLHHAENDGEDNLEYICISFGLDAPSILIKILGLLYRKTASKMERT